MNNALHKGWIGVDLDGTLAHYDEWRGAEHIGAPISAMVERVRQWLASGIEVKIFTARVACEDPAERAFVIASIEAWAEQHIGRKLLVTNTKDYSMVQLWDDRAVGVIPNTGREASSDRAMTELVGHMLATLHVNFERKTLTSADDGQLAEMLAAWTERFNAHQTER
ncbi:MAG: hypothetical protein ACEQSB_05550 [Undibacterium sp.]